MSVDCEVQDQLQEAHASLSSAFTNLMHQDDYDGVSKLVPILRDLKNLIAVQNPATAYAGRGREPSDWYLR